MTAENSETHILLLPNELLMKIIEFVSKRSDVSLVCQRFYDLTCKIERNRMKILIDDEKMVRNINS